MATRVTGIGFGGRGLIRALAVAALLLLSGCPETPDERVVQAQQAAELEDEKAFLLCFTQKSAELFRQDLLNTERSRKRLRHFKNIFDLMPQGTIGEVDARGDLALVTIEDGNKKHEIHLVREDGFWMIDGFSLPKFWKPLEQKAE